jgi:LPS sulfotransferase NodH
VLKPGRRGIGRALTGTHDRLVAAGIAPGHRDYRPFVIVSRARSGSNLLVSLLGSHPQIDARGELLKRLHDTPVDERLAQIYGRKPRRIRAVGFKCFYYHPLDDRQAPVWPHLAAIEQLHVVHLRRRNALRTLTSRRLAELTGEWVDHRPDDEARASTKPKVRFDTATLRAELEQDEAWATACRQRFAGHPVLEVVYEDLIAPSGTHEDLLAFLGVAPHPLRTTLRRQNPEPLSALIEGFDDLRTHFEDTPWADCFDETSL